MGTRGPLGGRGTRSDPPADWYETIGGDRLAAFYIWQGISHTTRASYQAAVNSYTSFARERRFAPIFPATAQGLMAWVGSFQGRVEAGTLKHYLSGLRSHHVDIGFPIDQFSNVTLERCVRGYRRHHGEKPVRQALPLTLPLIEAMVRYYTRRPPLTPRAATFIAVFTLAFGCFLRMGEVTFDVFDPRFNPQRCDVNLGTNPPTFNIKASKTDVFRQSTTVAIPEGSAYACPRRALHMFLNLVPGRASDPLFAFDGKFPKKLVVDEVHRVLTEIGVAPPGYTGHSFRRGAATWAHQIGLPDSEIQRLGRWAATGESYRRYIDVPLLSSASVAGQLYNTTSCESRREARPPPKRVHWAPDV